MMYMSKHSMEAQKNIQIKLTFGDDSQQKKLIQVDAKLQIGVQDEQMSKMMIEEHNAVQNDVFIMIKFRVAVGRQKQATQYLQKGMDSIDIQEDSLNPIQKILVRPKTTGRVFFNQKQGQVIVYYIFYHEKIYDEQYDQDSTLSKLLQIQKDLAHSDRPKLYFNFFVSGQQSKSLKDRASIVANYSQVNINVINLKFSQVSKVLKTLQIVPEEIKQFPLYKMLQKGLKRIKFKTNLNSIRKVMKMYNQAANKQNDKRKSDPYVHKNLLKNKIQIVFSWKMMGILKGEIRFNEEDQMQRIAGMINQAGQQL